MTVSITGCVNNPGEHEVISNCTLQEAISLADGIREDEEFKPTGKIIIRKRISGYESEKIKEINFHEDPKILRSEVIPDGYIVIIQIDGEHYEKYGERRL